MGRKNINSESIPLTYYTWRLFKRRGIYCADGRAINKNENCRRSLGTHDRAEALARLRELDAKAYAVYQGGDSGHPHAGNSLTVEQGIAIFLEGKDGSPVTGGVSEGTLTRYGNVAEKFAAFAKAEGAQYWSQVNDQLCRKYLKQLDKPSKKKPLGYAPRTLSLEGSTVKQIQKYLIKNGDLTGVTALSYSTIKPSGTDAYCPTPEEVDAIIRHCQSTKGLGWLAEVVIALATTGFRISELAALTWEDVEFKDGSAVALHIRDETFTPKGKKSAGQRSTKGKCPRRVPVNPVLRDLLAQRPEVAQDGKRGNTVVFTHEGGSRLDHSRVLKVLKRVARLLAAEDTSGRERTLANMVTHSLRHYFISEAASSGKVSEQVVMKWVGHKDSKLVRHYFHLHDQRSNQLMNELSLLDGVQLLSGRPIDSKRPTAAAATGSEVTPSTTSAVLEEVS